jgi:hypothetical protein
MKTLVFALLSFALIGCSVEPRIETSPQKYSTLITQWTPTGLVAHFPNPLPATASNIKLSAFPGFLQGGAWFQVRLTLPAAEVSKVYGDASKIAKDFYDGGTQFTSVTSKTNGLPGTYFHTSDNEKHVEFPADYRIFVFVAQDAGGNPPWQSGTSYGVVISKQRNEVIYYAENW